MRSRVKSRIEWMRRQKKPIQKLVRIDKDLAVKVWTKILHETGKPSGFSKAVNQALAWLVEPQGWAVVFGTDNEGIVSVTLHSTRDLAEKFRRDKRASWNPIAADGVYFGRSWDGDLPCWIVIRPVLLDSGKLT